MITNHTVPGQTAPDPYRSSTACVQSEADQTTRLAESLWPESGGVVDYAANIQRHVREMKQIGRPRSLDALGILHSGANGICTANANLATALLRSKGIATRSIAVIPPMSVRLEMHRVVEYFDEGKWYRFDPSSLDADVPMKPWQSIVMSQTTIADENLAMQPRMGASLGCPYGQELESMTNGISLWGQDFFWTMAKPIAEFEANDDAIALATHAWQQYLQTGALEQEQLEAALARNAEEFLDHLRAK